MNIESNSSVIESKKNNVNTLSGIFAFVGFIALSIGLMIELHYLELFIYYGLVEELGENLSTFDAWYIVKWLSLFIAIAFNIVSLVLAIIDFNKKVISRDRLFVHISLLIFNFFLFIIHYI